MTARRSSNDRSHATSRPYAATARLNCIEVKGGGMARIEDVKRENLSPRQQKLHDDFLRSRPRAALTGPFAVLIHTPDIAEPADKLVNYFRQKATIGRRLVELVILLVGRSASVQYAWSVHEPQGLKEGFSQDVIDAIRDRKRPDLKRD